MIIMDRKDRLTLMLKTIEQIRKHLSALTMEANRALPFLERSYEECFAYPDYEQKSELYSDRIIATEKRLEKYKESEIDMDSLKKRFEELLNEE